MFALVDVNNFYASCETVFRPDLKGKPIIVLSNNDGCVIARNAEAKALGITMAVPFFKMREIIARHNVQVFSSNYALYADMSTRVMTLLEEMARRLFEEWFVQFHFPGHEDVPISTVRDVRLPQGWSLRRLGDLTSVLSRGIAPASAGHGPHGTE